MTVAIALSILLNYPVPNPKLVTMPYNLIGLVIVGIGSWLIFWSRHTLESHKTTLDPKGRPTSLLTSGPYRFSRNPIYTGLLLMTLGASLFLASPLAFIGPVFFFIFINNTVIPSEERTLSTVFGTTYVEYTHRVRRWL